MQLVSSLPEETLCKLLASREVRGASHDVHTPLLRLVEAPFSVDGGGGSASYVCECAWLLLFKNGSFIQGTERC